MTTSRHCGHNNGPSSQPFHQDQDHASLPETVPSSQVAIGREIPVTGWDETRGDMNSRSVGMRDKPPCYMCNDKPGRGMVCMICGKRGPPKWINLWGFSWGGEMEVTGLRCFFLVRIRACDWCYLQGGWSGIRGRWSGGVVESCMLGVFDFNSRMLAWRYSIAVGKCLLGELNECEKDLHAWDFEWLWKRDVNKDILLPSCEWIPTAYLPHWKFGLFSPLVYSRFVVFPQ